MREFLWRAVSTFLIVLTVVLAFSSAIISATAKDTETAESNVNTLMTGIDISGWQDNVNWESVKSSGVEFAMFRLTSYTPSSHSYVEDPMLESHISGAKSQGIHIGGYFFSYAKSVDEVRAEADMVIGILEKYPQTFNFPIVFDAESANIQGFAADACVSFCEILEENGYYVMIYANNNWFNNVITPAGKIADFDLWQAYYPLTEPNIEKYRGYTPSQLKSLDFSSRKALKENNQSVFMWQMTQQGTVSGIGTNCVDLDVCIRDYSKIISAHGFNGFTATTTQPHSYQTENGHEVHYQVCSGCGDKHSVVAHSYTAQYKDGTYHDMKCSCQYVNETVEHKFEYVIDEGVHRLQCECGYVQPGSEVAHSYDIVLAESDKHFYNCICGDIQGDGSGNEHLYVLNYNEGEHYNRCDDCGYIDSSSKETHDFLVQRSDTDGHWKECKCGVKDVKQNHTPNDEKCTVCGYSVADEVDDDEPYDEDAEIKPGEDFSGCDASVGATAVISAVAAIGCSLAFRKKEDN